MDSHKKKFIACVAYIAYCECGYTISTYDINKLWEQVHGRQENLRGSLQYQAQHKSKPLLEFECEHEGRRYYKPAQNKKSFEELKYSMQQLPTREINEIRRLIHKCAQKHTKDNVSEKTTVSEKETESGVEKQLATFNEKIDMLCREVNTLNQNFNLFINKDNIKEESGKDARQGRGKVYSIDSNRKKESNKRPRRKRIS